MKIECPKCQDGIELREGACPTCGFTLTLGSVVRHYWRKLRTGVRERAVIQCPSCGQPVPINAKVCPNPECAAAITFEATVSKASEGPRRHARGVLGTLGSIVRRLARWFAEVPQARWQAFVLNAGPGTRRLVQWAYCLLSVLLLVLLLWGKSERLVEDFGILMLVALVFFPVLAIVAKQIVPTQVFEAVATRTSSIVKLGLLCNYMLLLVVVHFFVASWTAQVMLMFGLLVLSVLGIWIARAILSPSIDQDNTGEEYDPSMPQGRRGRYD